MLDIFRKSFLIGLGALAVSKEKLEEVADELAARGQMNREEAKKYAQELMEKGKAEGESFRQSVRREFERMRSQCGPVSQKDFERLEKRIAVLEEKLGITPVVEDEPSTDKTEEATAEQAGEESK